MEAISPSDIIAGIFHFYKGEKFDNDREKIHKAFFEIRKKHPALLKNLIFRENILFPRSRILDQVLSGLQPGVLGKINPNYDVYEIKRENLKKRWDKYLKQELKGKEEVLEEIAEELKKLLGNET